MSRRTTAADRGKRESVWRYDHQAIPPHGCVPAEPASAVIQDLSLFLIGYESRWLARQRALPDAGEQFFELSEILGPKLSAPLVLDVVEYVVDF